MNSKFIGYLKRNRYAYHIYDSSRNMKKGRLFFVVKEAIRAVCKHGIFLNDYYAEIEKNNYIFDLDRYGIQFYIPLYKSDCIQATIVRDEDFYCINDLKYLKEKWIPIGGDILDIGANIGNHTIYFAKECNARSVYSFEPQSDIFDILNKNIIMNNLESICEIHNVALGAIAGTAEIENYNPHNTGGTSFKMQENGQTKVNRLDDYDFDNIDFIKIDVEGFEYDVLLGGAKDNRKI